ncbi:MAG: M23 family metallopeptidase [Bacteroidales bacterium]|nr:M23 family metallopeptidase [Bacteroidales bacterium]
MKILLNTLILFSILIAACTKDKQDNDPLSDKITVIINDVPFRTDQYQRIGYTLKIWEYEKNGLALQQIIVLDNDSKAELMKIDKAEIPRIYKDPLQTNPYFTNDKIFHYYLSIQVPIPLGQAVPESFAHSFVFRDTIQNKEVIVEGGVFSPRKSELPVSIKSPVKGSNWLFINQSTLGYHFNSLFFMNGKIGSGERYAFDNLIIDEQGENYSGDPTVNESYFNYKDTLFAVADGTIVTVKDGRPENSGNACDVKMITADELAGNYLMLDIGYSRYAIYAHCVPNSFLVQEGDVVKEGDPIALSGNSGNSTGPHLHFQICDTPEFFLTNGLPFVLKNYTKIGVYGSGEINPPIVITDSMMEEMTIMSFD